MIRLRDLSLLLLLCASSIRASEAWGRDGHQMTCVIAEALLTEEARAGVKALLPPLAGGVLSSMCAWADEIRQHWNWHWSYSLHFVDTPDFACNFNFQRDCRFGRVKESCVVGAIANYSALLRPLPSASFGLSLPSSSSSSSSSEVLEQRIPKRLVLIPPSQFMEEMQAEESGKDAAEVEEAVARKHQWLPDPNQPNPSVALLFLAHFMGDVHQPLHVGFTSDKGGNAIHVKWFGSKHNLHEVWDDEFFYHALKVMYKNNRTALVEEIADKLANEWRGDVPSWTSCSTSISNTFVCPSVYAAESVKAACKWAYRNATPGSLLDEAYFSSRFPLIQQQIAKGGVRLAWILNNVFKSPPSTTGI